MDTESNKGYIWEIRDIFGCEFVAANRLYGVPIRKDGTLDLKIKAEKSFFFFKSAILAGFDAIEAIPLL